MFTFRDNVLRAVHSCTTGQVNCATPLREDLFDIIQAAFDETMDGASPHDQPSEEEPGSDTVDDSPSPDEEDPGSDDDDDGDPPPADDPADDDPLPPPSSETKDSAYTTSGGTASPSPAGAAPQG
jgi:hypothetical protein